MGKIRRLSGVLFGVALSVMMLGTKVYAEEITEASEVLDGAGIEIDLADYEIDSTSFEEKEASMNVIVSDEEVLISDEFTGKESSERLFYDGAGDPPVVRDLHWDSAGHFTFTSPSADAYYSVYLTAPNTDNYMISAGVKVGVADIPVENNVAAYFDESGTYEVKVKSSWDGKDYDFFSGPVTDWVSIDYVRPQNQYPAPTNPHWLENGIATWDPVEGNPKYNVYFYENSVYKFRRGSGYENSYDASMFGEGNWTFTVKAYGDNPGEIASSPASEMSPSFGGMPLPVVTDLKWEKPGIFSFTIPNADAYYSFYVEIPGAAPFISTNNKMVMAGIPCRVNITRYLENEGTYRARVKTTMIYNDADFTTGAVSEWVSFNYVKGYLADGGDGNWYLYRGSTIDTSYTGIFEDAEHGAWLVLDGRVAFEYNDLYSDDILGFIKILNGTIDYGYTDLFFSPHFNGWYKISEGKADFEYSDLYFSPQYGWWKIRYGMVDFNFNDLYESPQYGWWKVTGGAVDFGYTELYESPQYGWWKIYGGAVDFGYNDLYFSPSCGWWKIYGGAVDFGYSDLYGSPTCGWWKVTGGMVDFGYTDLYGSPTCGWWLVNGGAVDFGYTDIFKSPSVGNWKVYGGTVDFGFNGVYNSPRYGRCYVNGGAAAIQ